MKVILWMFTIAVTLTNGIFLVFLYSDLAKHEEIINRQGEATKFIIETPEIQAVLLKELQRRSSSTSQNKTKK